MLSRCSLDDLSESNPAYETGRIFFMWGLLWRAAILLACVAIALNEKRKRDLKLQETRQQSPGPEKKERPPVAIDFTTRSGGDEKPKRRVRGRAKVSRKIPSTNSNIAIFYSTLLGSSARYAEEMRDTLSQVMSNEPLLLNIDYLDDIDDYFVSPKYAGYIYVLILPSYETESPLDFFLETLNDTYHDFRVPSKPLSKLTGFSVFGLGDSESWPEKFCYQAKQADKLMSKLGCRRIFPLGTACVKTTGRKSFTEYMSHFIMELKNPSPIIDTNDESDSDSQSKGGDDPLDVEDLGRVIDNNANKNAMQAPKEMVAKDSPTYKALTKQGYTVVGSHSGVKICRWTKSALRGRGSCYKFSFYGIKSHLCMETTPSLSCSNKCVFCWRHGTNPVGTTWRWQVDEPEDVFNGALTGHYQKIKQMRGVPGVQAERFAEAFRVRHCALSLVGEPIFYPHINRFLELLHGEKISSFLVCNAQHPQELRSLNRVTQLYVSIDASNKESLKRVDRPLHRDFWERLEECLDILRDTQGHQRTVYRLTLVKGFNIEDVEGYADMVERGRPSFIEVKGATFCGNSDSNSLRMSNIPFYQEVQGFVEALERELRSRGCTYSLAAEHAHSCCVLLANDSFKINGKWYTHIDYPRFFELLESGKEFGPLDYISETPDWAYWGSEEAGFNPVDVRHYRGKPIE